MKNNFSNFVKIVAIIILIFLIIYIIFYLITKNDLSTVYKKNYNTEIDENITLIEDELTTVFSYVNGSKISTTNNFCNMLNKENEFDISKNENFFDYYGVIILGCLENKEYLIFNYYVLFNENDEKELLEKFLNIKKLPKTSNVLYENSEFNINNFYLAYELLNENNINDINYSIKRIFKKDENVYEVIILARDNKNNLNYYGNLAVHINNKKIQYNELIFY